MKAWENELVRKGKLIDKLTEELKEMVPIGIPKSAMPALRRVFETIRDIEEDK